MFKCLNCDYEFEEPKRKEVLFETHFKVENLFGGRHKMDLLICPNCNSQDIEELQKCDICHEYFLEDELVDTEGMLNGGVGYACEQCIEDGDIKYI